MIFKDKLARGQLYPIKYADLEASVKGRSSREVYLYVHFSRFQAYWKDEREKREAQGRYDLAVLSFPLEGPRWFEAGTPWEGTENPTVVSASIKAIPAHAALAGGFQRPYFKNVLLEQVRRLTPTHIPWPRWHLRVILLVPDRVIECVSTQWTGLRKEPELRKVISLDTAVMQSMETVPAGEQRKP